MKESTASAWRICHSYRRAEFVASSHAAFRLVLVPVGTLREMLSGIKGKVLFIGPYSPYPHYLVVARKYSNDLGKIRC